MVIIVSSLGPINKYKDTEMMKRTFQGFLSSLRNQIDQNFRLFLSFHDIPNIDYSIENMTWCSVADPKDRERTLLYDRLPKLLDEKISYSSVPYSCPITDCGRKQVNAMIEAGKWIYERGIDNFWMLRCDSDDLLAKDYVAILNQLDVKKVRAVFNRKCHMFDIQQRKIGIVDHNYSTTWNAIYLERIDNELKPNWFYLNNNHTLFINDIIRDRIPSFELDFNCCIITNSGNSISNRPALEKEQFFKEEIPLTKELIDRYGLESLL